MKLLALLLALLPIYVFANDSTYCTVGDTVLVSNAEHQTDTMPDRRNRIQRWSDSVKQRITNKLNEPYDTIRDNRYWWRAMKHGKVNFNDSTMGYPKFVMFCYKVYKWGDRTFNTYDTTYVVPTGKNWKLTLKNLNWIDNIAGGNDYGHALFTSGLASNIGLYLSFMAVSVGYALDIDRIFGARGTSEMIEFSFTCARFTAEVHKTVNSGRMKSRIKYNDGDWHRGDNLNALRREAKGLSATYFFNNRKYARGAAYCFSKYQRRSAGSALAGFSISNYDFKIDTKQLTSSQAEEFSDIGATHVRYTDYCLRAGYAYNWVINRRLLFNATGTIGAGIKHIHHTESHSAGNSGALNLAGNFALTYNLNRFFASFQTNVNTSIYFAGKRNFSYTVADFTTAVGIRF